MDNIRNVIKILFRYTSPQEVLCGKMNYYEVQLDSFMLIANSYIPYYSNNEIRNMFSFFQSEFEWHNNKMRGCVASKESHEINVFDAIILFVDTVLVEENRNPCCRYEHLLRWRDMVVSLDEDLFTTAFLANKDLQNIYDRREFFWSPVIGHNNKELNRLLEQGVAENHFHLKGSSPTFHLSWISMMNDVTNPDFCKIFNSYEKRRLSRKVVYQRDYVESSLYESYLQAALIRLYLFACLQNDYFTLRSDYVSADEILPHIINMDKDHLPDGKLREIECELKKPMVSVDKVMICLKDDIYVQIKKNLMYRDVALLLNDTKELLFYLPEIQKNIVNMREKYTNKGLDYTLCQSFQNTNTDHINEVICGERWFMYEVFKRAFSEDSEFMGNLNWFYAYILIKENIRSEIIQTNGNVGFNNFLEYQNRKESFIDKTPFENVYLQMAVRDTIKNQHIKRLEARITPKDTSYKLNEAILKNDKCILEVENEEAEKEKLKNQFFYVCHFIKEPDEGFENVDYYQMECRHYKKRIEVKKQAYAIFNLRRQYRDTAQRLKGIDAASEEIGCRPEVFAQAFRFLKDRNIVCENSSLDENRAELPDLCATYHAGEDFLDLVDGLRAIDETISFLNLRCGDRLGHALALGVDVEEWYESKSNRILISQMDYLDNLVWLYAKIRKYRIEGCEDAVRYIEKRYDEYFRIVYLNHMYESDWKAVSEQAIQYFEEKNIENNYGYQQCYFSINTYYDSWKLRGDDPECFRDGFFKLKEFVSEEWDEYGVNKISRKITVSDIILRQPICTIRIIIIVMLS